MTVMTEAMGTVIAAVVASIVGFITALLTSYYSLRQVKLEMRTSYRSELAKRQIDACEAFWEIFGSASMTEGEHRIIKGFDSNPVLVIEEVEAFIERFQVTFTSKAGLYLSEVTRRKLHEFRDELIQLKNEAKKNSKEVKLTRQQADKVKDLRRDARLALRAEIGTTNLTVANTEFKAYK